MGCVTAAVLAIDGGNSKTEVCLITADGALLGYARGPGSTIKTSVLTPHSMSCRA